VPLAGGSHEVVVEYRAPTVVQVAYWGCAAAWVAFITLLLPHMCRSGHRPEGLI
jgi:hypothetical protein